MIIFFIHSSILRVSPICSIRIMVHARKANGGARETESTRHTVRYSKRGNGWVSSFTLTLMKRKIINDGLLCRKDEEPCSLIKVPFWYKDKTERPSGIPPPVGDINDYSYEKFDKTVEQDVKLSEKLDIDHPGKYIPGAIHRLQVLYFFRV